MKTPTRSFALLTALACSLSAATAQEVTLKYKFEKDDKQLYRKTQKLQQKQEVAGMKIATTMSHDEITERTLKGVTDKGAMQIQTENKRLKVAVKIGPLGDYTFNSESSDNERGSTLGGALTPVYESLAGAYITVTISPLGKIVGVKGYKELLAEALKDNPLGKQFTGGGSNEMIKMSISEYFPQVPKKAIEPGHKWEVPYEIKLEKFGQFKGKRYYTFQGMEKVGGKRLAKLTDTTELSAELDLEQGGAKVVGTLSVEKSSGTTYFDPVAGRVVKISRSYTMGGMLTVTAGGMDIPVKTTQTQTVTLELLDKLPSN